MNILFGVTGSVAATLYHKLFLALDELGQIRPVFTKSAIHFTFDSPDFDSLPGCKECNYKLSTGSLKNNKAANYYSDDTEWRWRRVGDPIQHIELRDWADILVIAPLSANTLAKMANGLCDNLLTSIYRAWPVYKPIVIAPAMNTEMWNHPITAEHIGRLTVRHSHGIKNFLTVVQPVEKKLACGTTGIGAMANIEDIVNRVRTQAMMKLLP